MKRVIAVMMLLVMIPAACFASVNLDTMKRIMEYAVSRMESMVTVYDLHPGLKQKTLPKKTQGQSEAMSC